MISDSGFRISDEYPNGFRDIQKDYELIRLPE